MRAAYPAWPTWRPASQFPHPGRAVLVTLVDPIFGRGVPYLALAERPGDGPWLFLGGTGHFGQARAIKPECLLGWMPLPSPMELSTGLSTKGASATGKDEDDLT